MLSEDTAVAMRLLKIGMSLNDAETCPMEEMKKVQVKNVALEEELNKVENNFL